LLIIFSLKHMNTPNLSSTFHRIKARFMKSRGRQRSQTSIVFLPISLSIDTYALLVYILSSRQFKTKIQGYSVYSERIETLFWTFWSKEKKLKLLVSHNCISTVSCNFLILPCVFWLFLIFIPNGNINPKLFLEFYSDDFLTGNTSYYGLIINNNYGRGHCMRATPNFS
jgi:hypothetical protein